MMTPRKKDLKIVLECLRSGIALERPTRRGMRRFTAGEITEQIRGKRLRTTHVTDDGMSHIWIDGEALAALARQATEKLARKDEILAEQAAASRRAYGHD